MPKESIYKSKKICLSICCTCLERYRRTCHDCTVNIAAARLRACHVTLCLLLLCAYSVDITINSKMIVIGTHAVH